MIRLKKSTLMGPEFFEFSFKEFVLMTRDLLFVENEHVGYIVLVDLFP